MRTLVYRIGVLMLAAAGEASCVNLGVSAVQPSVWDAQLVPAVAYPDLNGQGAAVSQADGTSVGLTIHGAVPGAQHTWSLRLGTCATPGLQLGLDSDYPVLAVDAGGTASGDTQIASTLVAGRAYHLAVRLSATDTTRVACGDLVAR
jgi:hypothetical protein